MKEKNLKHGYFFVAFDILFHYIVIMPNLVHLYNFFSSVSVCVMIGGIIEKDLTDRKKNEHTPRENEGIKIARLFLK